MTQKEICEEISALVDGLYSGTVHFGSNDKFRLKKYSCFFHPADVIIECYKDVELSVKGLEEDVSKERLKKLRDDLQTIAKDFKFKALETPVAHLTEYLGE